MLASWKKSPDKPRQHIKKQRHYFADKGPSNQSYGSSSSHVWMWELDHKEGWVLKNWWFWTVVLEKTLVGPLDRKGIKPVNAKGNQPGIFIGRNDAEAEAVAVILWQPDAKSWLIVKDTNAGKDWGKEKRTTEDQMAGWHHRLDGHEFEQWTWVGRTGKPGMLQSMGVPKSQIQLSNWTTTTIVSTTGLLWDLKLLIFVGCLK